MKNIKEFNKEEFLKNYNPFKKTAFKRTALSQPMKLLLNKGLLNDSTILDFGTGWGLDYNILSKQYKKEKQITAFGYDLFNEQFYDTNLLKDKYYKNLTCFYVLNVLPILEEQEKLIKLFKSLADNVYIAVRSDNKAIKDNWLYVNEWEGYITPKLSFQRFYNEESIKRYFGNVTYISNNNSFKLFRLTD